MRPMKHKKNTNSVIESAFKRLRFSIIKWQIAFSLLLTLWIAGDVAGFWPSGIMTRLELVSYDYRIPLMFEGEPDPSLVIIDIDEHSISTLGQWPWPRRVVAELIDTLFATYGIAVLGVNVVFSEPESNVLASEWQLIRELYPQLPPEIPVASGDARLASVIANWPVVLGYYFSGPDSAFPQVVESVGALPPPLQVVSEPPWASLNLPWIQAERFNGNLEQLQEAANAIGAGGGFFDNPSVDIDGVFRRAPLLQKGPDGNLYAALSLAVLSELLGNPPVTLDIAPAAGSYQLEGLDVGGFRIPTDSSGMALVPWYGSERHFRYVSAVDVLTGNLPVDAISGAIVLLGTSAPGLKDSRATPVAAVYPGVEINLTLLAGMLHQRFLAEPDYARAASLVILLLLGIAGTLSMPWLNSMLIIVASASLLLLHVLGNLWIWQNGLVLAFAPSALLIVLLTGWNLLCNYLRESRRVHLVRSRFGQYVPPELVTDIIRSDKDVSLEGEEREMTLLFSDVREFTAFSEQLSPAQLTDIMNRLFIVRSIVYDATGLNQHNLDLIASWQQSG
ncbi:CHASE2 domain-containing protein [Gammaproteobacteria bacterium LSUCC0112]|nr:CHASE2 domain-containing protein [Gammaproteobacteria bacterium LSUCC0112]